MDVKFGIIDFALPGKRIGNIKLASDMGLNGMQIIYITPEDEPFMLDWKWHRDYYLEMGDKYNVKFPSVNVSDFDYTGMLHPKNTEKGKLVYDIIDRTIDMASYMKMQMVLYPSFGDGEIRTEEELEITAEALRYGCDEAAKHGMDVTSENTLSPEWTLKLAKLVDRPNFSISYDTQNYWRVARLDQLEVIDFLYKNDLLYPEIHVKDGIDSVISSQLIGDGNANVPGSLEYLKNINYDGWLYLENYYSKKPLCERGGDIFDLLRQDVKRMKGAFEE